MPSKGIPSLLGAAAFVPGFAHAQDTDFAREQFEPLPSQGTNILYVGRSPVIRHLMLGVVGRFRGEPGPATAGAL